jgi:hypothetical protein
MQVQHSITRLSLSRHGLIGEINILVRLRTELQCVVKDLKAIKNGLEVKEMS